VYSARRALRVAAVVAAVAALSGCESTMEKNAHTLVINQRALASETPVEVIRPDPSLRVLGISVVRGTGGAALAVRLLNTSSRPLTDLPISVGIRTAGKRMYLNRSANSGYFESHIAAIGAGRVATWVYTARRLPGRPGTPFAAVGFPRLPATTTASQLPALAATVRGAVVHGTARVTVANRSGLPQYGLQVYAVALHGDRATAAARGSIAALDGGTKASLALHLVGDATGARLQLYVLPTIFT
jgi:hypothetical protein